MSWVRSVTATNAAQDGGDEGVVWSRPRCLFESWRSERRQAGRLRLHRHCLAQDDAEAAKAQWRRVASRERAGEGRPLSSGKARVVAELFVVNDVL